MLGLLVFSNVSLIHCNVQKLRDAVHELESEGGLDPRELSSLIDRLQAVLCRALYEGSKRGDHLLTGQTTCAWVATTCRLSGPAASDRLCVGEQLEAMPQVAQALGSGEIGYQATSVICHFRKKLREDLRELCDEEQWISHAKEDSIKDLGWLADHVRYVLDPDGFDHGIEEDWGKRFLSISESGGMFHISGVLDREGGAALESAIDGLAKRLTEDDIRSPKQRRADALTEIVYHAMEAGSLPRHNRVRPQISVSTTIEGLTGELGAAASELHNGMPVSSKTVQRLACDGLLHRVLKADSVVIDVSRATPTVSAAQWRALKARYKRCCFPGCDRPINWTHPHHIEFRSRGGPSTMRNLLPLCFYHHRLVHEGAWQVVRTGEGLRFIPPERPVLTRRRWGERRRAV